MDSHMDLPAPAPGASGAEPDFDAGTASLARALRLSFSVLKVVMLILVVAYLFSGVYTVQSHQVAIRLHLGEAAGVVPPGIHLAWPFPIDNIVYIDAKRERVIDVGTFWYSTPTGRGEKALREEREELRKTPKAEKVAGKGGYCLTGDRNLLHYYWSVKYVIDKPLLYFVNIAGIETTAPGADRPEAQLVRHLVENAVIRNVNQYKVLPAMRDRLPLLTERARAAAQKTLNDLQTGIRLLQVVASVPPIPPREVDAAFKNVFSAREESNRLVEAAEGYVNERLSRVAGNSGRLLYDAMSTLQAARDRDEVAAKLKDAKARLKAAQDRLEARKDLPAASREKRDLREEVERFEAEVAAYALRLSDLKNRILVGQMRLRTPVKDLPDLIERLYAQARGEVSRKIQDAKVYRERIVEDSRAQADAIDQLLKKYRNNRAKLQTYLRLLRLKTLEEVIGQAGGKYVVKRGGELRFIISPTWAELAGEYGVKETR